MKLKIIVNSFDSLKDLVKIDMTSSVAFRLAKLVKVIDENLKIFYSNRMSLYEKYGEKNEDDSITITPNNVKAFNDELNSLLEEDILIEIPEIKISDLKCRNKQNGILESIDIKIETLVNLNWLIKED